MNTHAFTQPLLPLEDPAPDGRTFVNSALWFVDSDGYRVIFRWHEPIYRVALTDEVHLRLVAVTLRQSRLATQEEICRAFGHGVSTQARWERQYRKYGVDGLMPRKRTGRPRELDRSQEAFVGKWFRRGLSNREIAKRLGVDETTIRRTLKRLGLARKPAVVPLRLPGIEDEAADAPTAEVIGLAPAAAVESSDEVPTQKPSSAEVCSAPSPERRRQDAPASFEPSAPSSLTVDHDPHDRSGDRALARLGLLDDAVPLFAEAECVPRAGVLLAVPLLVGHGLIEAFVKVYGSLRPSFYGLRTIVVTLFQAKKAQRQVVTPAVTDTWVHTADGEPLLVVTSEMNAKLTQVLEPILADVRRLVGDERRMTVIFDRGGFSPKLFARLIDAGFDVITYRKGKVKKLASTRFTLQKQKIDGVGREYTSGISGCGKCVCCARTDARRRSSPTATICRR
jgi:transposase